MTAIEPPAPDAPAEEWGAFATRIPDWRWPWTCSVLLSFCPSLPGYVWLEGEWRYTDDISPVARWSRIRAIPDPDHWAWEGWLLRLIGDERWRIDLDYVGEWSFWVNGPPETHGTGHLNHVGESLGRACIAAAASLGKWPGGEG